MRYLLLLLVPATAFAGHHYTRTPTLHIDVKTSERTKPIPTAPASHVPSTSGTEILALELEKEPIRQEQEALLIQLVNDTPDTDADKPDYMFRLAEQYARELRLWTVRSVQLQITAGPTP
jgi:hypothetical protein